ncbi:MAG: HD domain-containing protein [Oscillospiraceae bacterium]|nr:HD domain-containing protein [Oscillospiraceae bacterium]
MANSKINKALRLLKVEKLMNYFGTHASIPHACAHHAEPFDVHCLCVIGRMVEAYENGNASEELLLAACLHDIAKPRTAKPGKDGQAHFYGHEHVTGEELAEFLSPSYPGFERVADLVRGHSLPWQISEAGSRKLRKRLKRHYDALIEKYGSGFGKELDLLVACDRAGSVEDAADLPAARKEAERVKALLLQAKWDTIIAGFKFTGYVYVTCNTNVIVHYVQATGTLADGRKFRVSGHDYVEEVDNYYDEVCSNVVILLEEGTCMPLESFLEVDKEYGSFTYR